MTREELFRAIGEVREDQIEAAETGKRQFRPWRRFGALAACLALVMTAAAVPWLNRGQPRWKQIMYSFNPGVEVSAADGGTAEDTGEGTSAGGVDGTQYWTDGPDRPTHPNYSTDVEIGELSGAGNNPGVMECSPDAPWLTPEQILTQDTVIFRGIVQELQYFQVDMGFFHKGSIGISVYYTRALVEVTDSIRGNLTEGKVYSLLWLGAKGYLTTSLSGPLEDLEVGSDAIFMPVRADRDTGWKEGDSYFCYADLAEYYLSEGVRYVFADAGEGLDFDRNVYPALETAETLDEVAFYLREMTGATGERGVTGAKAPENTGGYEFVEGTQKAVEEPSAAPEAAPSNTAQAPETPPSKSPNGARELPGGAFIGDEKSGVNP